MFEWRVERGIAGRAARWDKKGMTVEAAARGRDSRGGGGWYGGVGDVVWGGGGSGRGRGRCVGWGGGRCLASDACLPLPSPETCVRNPGSGGHRY